jgi:hypothetical protein
MRSDETRRDDTALPVKLDSASNGEYWPQPVDPAIAAVNRSALEAAARNARRVGMTRRRAANAGRPD